LDAGCLSAGVFGLCECVGGVSVEIGMQKCSIFRKNDMEVVQSVEFCEE
jgi:hypothetical protein